MSENMKRKIIIIMLLTVLLITGCNKLEKQKKTNDNKEVISSMKVTINDEEYTMNIENNETVTEFINKLPQDLKMNELNGNEKYVYLDYSLTSNPVSPKHINKGDVMLFGDNCLVIFYKSFDTSYSYTKIGHIDDLPDLGNSSINAVFKR